MATINNATRLGVPGLADTGDIVSSECKVCLRRVSYIISSRASATSYPQEEHNLLWV